MFKDVRRFQRLSLNTDIKFKPYKDFVKRIFYEDREIEATAVDIGEGGIGIQSRYFVPEKTYLEVWISLSSLNEEGQIVFYGPMKILGRVCWVNPYPDNYFRVGICFVDIRQDDKKVLVGFLNAHAGFKDKVIRKKQSASGAILDKPRGAQSDSLSG